MDHYAGPRAGAISRPIGGPEMIEKTLLEIPKSRTETLRLQLTKYRGHRLADLRLYVDGRATRKGISFRRDLMRDIGLALLAAAEEEAAAQLTADEVFGPDTAPPPAGDGGEVPLQPVPEGALGGAPL